jgi:hypothetical protein
MFYLDNTINTPTRYDMAKFISFVGDCFEPLNSYFLEALVKIPYSGVLTITTQEHRPDLISYDIYGSTQYWWIIMAYNGLSSINDIKAGDTITFPSLASLENLYFTLVSQEKTKV